MKNLKIGVTDVVLVLLSLAFLLGMLFLFGPCGPKEDGSWMSCHWAGNAVAGLATVLLAISLMHLAVPNRQVKLGLSLAVLPVSVLACLIPGQVISLCMMQDMRCRAVMTPAVWVFDVLLVVTAIMDALLKCKEGRG